MVHSRRIPLIVLLLSLTAGQTARAQDASTSRAAPPPTPAVFPTDDPVILRIWRLGVDSSQLEKLAQPLLDSIGPRLDGSPGLSEAREWLRDRYREWSVPTRIERYGTQRSWRRVSTHIDLIQPRQRTLEGTMLAWSPGTPKPIVGDAVLLPNVSDSMAFARWAATARGMFVLVSPPEVSCRPSEDWNANATPASLAEIRRRRSADSAAWAQRVVHTGYSLGLGTGALGQRLEHAGVAGVVTANWAGSWGVDHVFYTDNRRAPAIVLSCEDYGLVYRLAEHNQHPVLHLEASAQDLGEVSTVNLIAELRGVERPNEYVVLSAHLDSWDGASGATDNGTGTLVMAEALRILSIVDPHPKRTILVGHWGGEEMGLVGSGSFAQSHPDVVSGLQVLFNQDNGTGRVQILTGAGLLDVAPALARWGSQLPGQVSQNLTTFLLPGYPLDGSSDQSSFICRGAPGLRLRSRDWEYYTYTWHTNRDTYDKLVFDDLKNNAVLVATLAYMASEDPLPVGRRERTLMNRDGTRAQWPSCATVKRDNPRP
jgi:carboxypeptidase Q